MLSHVPAVFINMNDNRMRKYSLLFGFLFLAEWIFACITTDTIPVLSYEARLQQGIDSASDAESEMSYRNAFALLDGLFEAYPDSVDVRGFYEAAILAARLAQTDKAFKYLTPLVDSECDHGPGWEFFIGKYWDDAFEVLEADVRWKALVVRARRNKTDFYRLLQEEQNEFFNVKPELETLLGRSELSGTELYAAIREYKGYLPKKERDYSIAFDISDTVRTSYFVHLPESYDPSRAYPLLVCLHGAVGYTQLEDFQVIGVLKDFNRFYTSCADRDEVILVFPAADKRYNWMKPDAGFFMVPEIVKQVKCALHVDDDKVFVAGHSNGATGAFSYWMKQPSPFAGFFGFNTYPKVRTGGTFLLNGDNRFFVNFSTDQDYYYPPQANDTLDVLAHRLGLDYRDHRYNGYPHWFPAFDTSEVAFRIAFDEIKERRRNPFPDKVYRETDNVVYGRADWLEITALDTLVPRADWHKTVNFPIHIWLNYNDDDELESKAVDRKAFDFPYASGAVKATYKENRFNVWTSCVKSFRIYISPEMVDMDKKVQVYVNGKLRYKGKVDWDNVFLKKLFLKTVDRKQLWVGCIDVGL